MCLRQGVLRTQAQRRAWFAGFTVLWIVLGASGVSVLHLQRRLQWSEWWMVLGYALWAGGLVALMVGYYMWAWASIYRAVSSPETREDLELVGWALPVGGGLAYAVLTQGIALVAAAQDHHTHEMWGGVVMLITLTGVGVFAALHTTERHILKTVARTL